MTIQTEVIVFFLSCLLGGFFSFYYDCFRLLRKIIPHHAIIVFFEDIFYFASCSIIAFSFIVDKAQGEIRGFLFIGVILGYILYFFTISIVFMKIMEFLFIAIRKILGVILKIIIFITLPLKLIIIAFDYFFNKFHRFLCDIVKKIKKILLKSNLT